MHNKTACPLLLRRPEQLHCRTKRQKNFRRSRQPSFHPYHRVNCMLPVLRRLQYHKIMRSLALLCVVMGKYKRAGDVCVLPPQTPDTIFEYWLCMCVCGA